MDFVSLSKDIVVGFISIHVSSVKPISLTCKMQDHVPIQLGLPCCFHYKTFFLGVIPISTFSYARIFAINFSTMERTYYPTKHFPVYVPLHQPMSVSAHWSSIDGSRGFYMAKCSVGDTLQCNSLSLCKQKYGVGDGALNTTGAQSRLLFNMHSWK